MIAVVDMNRIVRHACFRILAADYVPVAVFYSTLSFVNSSALYDADLLVLGRTRDCRTKCKSLHWASVVRPNLKTLLLDSIEPSIRPLIEICNDPPDQLAMNDCGQPLSTFRMARRMGLLPGLNHMAFDFDSKQLPGAFIHRNRLHLTLRVLTQPGSPELHVISRNHIAIL